MWGHKKLNLLQKNKNLKQGIFITFEGGEGSGKTTLLKKVAGTLSQKGFSLVQTREPGGTPLGEDLRHVLLSSSGRPISPHAELGLFLAARAQHVEELILPALHRGDIVLCDRFNDSSIAYQGEARGLGTKDVADVCRFFSLGLEPSLTLYLDIDPQIGLMRAKKRSKEDRIEQEAIVFHQKIRDGFLRLQKEHPDRFHTIDASLSLEIVYEQAMQLIFTLLS